MGKFIVLFSLFAPGLSRLYLATYNVGTSNPEQRLLDLLSITSQKGEKFPDFYVIGLQEVKSQPQNMLLDTLFEDNWSAALRDILDNKGYIKLKSIRLQGLLLSVFSLRKHLLNIREIESEYTRTGLAGMWGNKGAVSIRLSIYGCSLCFVNSHLTAHDNQLKDRIEDYNSIIKDQDFHVEETSKILYHDYVFWMGDLNFRLLEDFDRTPEEIERSVLKKDLKKLLEHDQLKYVMNKGEAFSEFTEKDIEFAPTFKFEVGANAYDHKRRPAWCDRILYCVNSHNYENVILKVDQLSYKSHPSYVLSDHKPVSGDFNIKIPRPVNIRPRNVALKLAQVVPDQVFSDYSEHVVQFDKVPAWEEAQQNKAFYIVTKDIPATKDDWIGLFKENFTSLDDYVTYEYVHKCTTPVDERGPPTMERPQKYQVTIPDVPSRCRGNYCLVYFSQTEDKELRQRPTSFTINQLNE
ncbi:phosphatidylinositol 4,5-bisphosphate 5-phosphatase A isoform X2 [Dendroctonus ponderosae]|uniref:phosphatidylinositol 4,5-bisphosphate 5-phosphatase A isoform X2 n=1 Tax=Dendroctonus ponderosae TaxID=77166 RepID=UPI002035C606|nr:phosphatidylinositol 4,5-bisphosphate 5-phosphatase A isoform X2 [Dendroctonus ponderosae]